MFARIRKVLFWLHLVAGVTGGVIILVLAATGVVLAYEQQLLNWANRDYRSAPPLEGAPTLPVEDLVNSVWAHDATANPTDITFLSDPNQPASLSVGQQRTLYVNPYNGVVLGEGPTRTKSFLQFLRRVHTELAGKGAVKPVAQAIVGACNVAFLFMILSGLVLWIPRTWSKGSVRTLAVPRFRGPSKARDFNWHHVLGLWCAVPLLIITLTGVVLSYRWANRLLYTLTGSPVPVQGGVRGPKEDPPREPFPARALSKIEPHLDTVRRRYPDWQAFTLTLPRDQDVDLRITVDEGTGQQPQHKTELSVHRMMGNFTHVKTFRSQSMGQRLRAIVRRSHSGEVLGIVGQTVAALASAAVLVMVYTGFALSFRRFFRKRKDAVAAAEAPSQVQSAE